MRAVVLAMLVACKYQAPGDTVGDAPPSDDGQETDSPPIDAPPNAWLAGWSHRKSITIDKDQVSAPTGGLIDFPVLIQFPADAEIAAIAQLDGEDLAVTSDDAVTRLEVDLEGYSGGAATLWVKVPVLDDGADTRLYLYYGNPNPPPSNPAAVWSNQFLAVWHLDQNPNAGGADDIRDASAGGHHGQAEPTMTNADVRVGKAGAAIDFDGDDDFIDVPTAVNLGDQFTISGWVFLQGGSGIKTIFSNSLSGLNIPGCRLFIDSDQTSDRMAIFETSNGNGPQHLSATTSTNRVPAGAWTHIAVVANRTGGEASIFVNGVDRTVSATIRTDFANNASVELGRMGDTFEWPGGLDQIELASERRSVEWLGTSFSNQSAPDEFFDLGPQEADPD